MQQSQGVKPDVKPDVKPQIQQAKQERPQVKKLPDEKKKTVFIVHTV